jgi:hypothetical protein
MADMSRRAQPEPKAPRTGRATRLATWCHNPDLLLPQGRVVDLAPLKLLLTVTAPVKLPQT